MKSLNKPDQIRLEGRTIVFNNFSGEEKPMNKLGDRNFNLLMDDEEEVLYLQSLGWVIKPLRKQEPEDDQVYHMPVKINFNGRYPPRIYMVKSAGLVEINDKTVGNLDHLPLGLVDVTLNSSVWEVPGIGSGSGIKTYLNSMYVEVEEDAFANKYASLDLVGNVVCVPCEPCPVLRD